MFYKIKLKRTCSAKLGQTWRSGGFTLIELLVVISIATIIMTALVVQNNRWNDSLVVTTQAYELAMMIRQAQIYSLGVREDTAGSGDKFNIGYGVYFEINSPTQYKFFADRNNDLKLNPASEVLADGTKTLTRGVVIDKFCDASSGSETCFTNPPNRRLSISFLRPEPKANIRFLNSGGSGGSTFGAGTSKAKIYLKSPGGRFSIVTVEANGQVSITQ